MEESDSSRFAKTLVDQAVTVAVLLIVWFLLWLLVFSLSLLTQTTPLGLTLSDDLTALLAGGTIALAYAAVLQAYLAWDRTRAELSPRLEVQLVRLKDPSVLPFDPMEQDLAPLLDPTTKIARGTFSFLAIRIRNVGPGSAVAVEPILSVWSETSGGSKIGTRGTGSLPLPARSSELLSVKFALSPNEARILPLELFAKVPDETRNGYVKVRMPEQFIVGARATDVRGQRKCYGSIGFALSEVTDGQDSRWTNLPNAPALLPKGWVAQ